MIKKTKMRKKAFPLLITLVLLSCINYSTTGNSGHSPGPTKEFEATILNSNYAAAYSILTVLTGKELKIIYRSDLEGEKDRVLFSKTLIPSDTLRQISEINLDELQEYYSNQCIDDGSQVTVTLRKDGKTKAVHLSNYYQEDIGKVIYLVNSLVPEKYKVWYDKDELISAYKRCNEGK